MAVNKGYPLPADLEPENDRCFVVYVPDAPEYVRAFFGSLTGLEKWNVWERTGDTSGSVAGRRWKVANQRTIAAEKVVDCGFLDELLEDGDMSVTVNNNVSCGSCGGNCGGTCQPPGDAVPNPEFHAPPEVYDEIGDLPLQTDPIFGPPSGFPTREDYLTYKCLAAHALARDILDTVMGFSTISGVLSFVGVTAIGAFLAGNTAIVAAIAAPLVLVGFTSSAIAIAIALILFMAVLGPIFFFYFEAVANEMETHFDDLVCDLYSSATVDEARQKVSDRFLFDLGGVVWEVAEHEDIFTTILLKALAIIMPDTVMSILFAAGEVVIGYVEERDEGSDCSECEEPDISPEGYLIIPAGEIVSASNVNSGTHVIESDNRITFVASENGGTSYTVNHLNATNWYALLVHVSEENGDWRNDVWGSSGGAQVPYVPGVHLLFPAAVPGGDVTTLTSWAEENGYLVATPGGTSPPGWNTAGANVRSLKYDAGSGSLDLRYFFVVPEA